MSTTHPDYPKTILICAGVDPSGGAGLTTDVITIAELGGHALALATAWTIQDGVRFMSSQASPTLVLEQQFNQLKENFCPQAAKLGFIPTVAVARTLLHGLQNWPDLSLVCDPILAAGQCATPMVDSDMLSCYREEILPRTTLATPNRAEALSLSQESDPEKAIERLLQSGCANVLITSARREQDKFVHLLAGRDVPQQQFYTRIRPTSIHGTGCRLSTALAYFHQPKDSWVTTTENALKWLDTKLDETWPIKGERHFIRPSKPIINAK